MGGYYKNGSWVRMWGGFMWLRIRTRGTLGSNIFLDISFKHNKHTKN